MRITSNTASDHLLAQLQTLASRQAALQKQASTGLRVHSMEVDPLAVREAMSIHADASRNEQYLNNISRHLEKATATFNTLRDLKKISDRAQEIAVLADDLKSPEELSDYAVEIAQLIEHAASLGNGRHGDEFLFSGTSLEKPFEMDRNAEGAIAGVRYQGTNVTNRSQIGKNALVSSTIPGAAGGAGERGLFTDAISGADFFNHLIQLRNNLEQGNTAAIANTDRAALARDEGNFLHHITASSALHGRLEAAKTSLQGKGTELQKQISARVDADLAQTMVQFSQTQTAYQVALQSAGNVMSSMSLMDYLR